MSNTNSQSQKMFCKLLERELADDGQFYDGHFWTVRPLEEWAEMMGVTTRTIRRWITQEPIQKLGLVVEGKRATLLRVGEPGEPTPLTISRVMAKAFRQQTGKPPNRKYYGCLMGLAENWPDGRQVEVFKYTLKPENWAAFMLHVKSEITLAQEAGQAGLKLMYFKHPHIPTILRFEGVALDLWKEALGGTSK